MAVGSWDKGSEAKWLRAHLDGIGYEITRTLVDAFEVRTPWTLHEQLEPLVSVWATGADTPQPPSPMNTAEYETVEVDGIPVHHDHTHVTWLSASGNARVWVEIPFRYDRRNLKPLDGVSQRELAFIGPLIRATAGSDPDPLPHAGSHKSHRGSVHYGGSYRDCRGMCGAGASQSARLRDHRDAAGLVRGSPARAFPPRPRRGPDPIVLRSISPHGGEPGAPRWSRFRVNLRGRSGSMGACPSSTMVCASCGFWRPGGLSWASFGFRCRPAGSHVHRALVRATSTSAPPPTC